jgi:hypothetical protein
MRKEFALNNEDIESDGDAEVLHVAHKRRREHDSRTPSPALPTSSPDFTVKKKAVIIARYQARTKQGLEEASAALVEYCRFMTLKIAVGQALAEFVVAPPRIREMWKLHAKVDEDYARDCETAGASAPLEPQYFVATDSPCGATGAKIRTVHKYFVRYDCWPPVREWHFGDEAVDSILEVLPRDADSDSG